MAATESGGRQGPDVARILAEWMSGKAGGFEAGQPAVVVERPALAVRGSDASWRVATRRGAGALALTGYERLTDGVEVEVETR